MTTWDRATEIVHLSNEQLQDLIEPAFPHESVAHSSIAAGGLANTNYCLTLAPTGRKLLLHLFVRDPAAAPKEFALYKLISSKLPSPKLIHGGDTNPHCGHPYAILEWIEGDQLKNVIGALDANSGDLLELGTCVGEALAAVHSFKFKQFGFLDQSLNVPVPMSMGKNGLLSYAQECLNGVQTRDRLGARLSEELVQFIEREGGVLDEWDGLPCLTHCDFGPSNILVQKTDGHWRIAVIDWEFAFAGTPFFDFGNLLRKPLGALPEFERGVTQGYVAAGAILPHNWRKMSRLTDLTAWLEFLSRANPGQSLISDARMVIADTIREH